MATREDQAKAIVLDVLIFPDGVGVGDLLETARHRLQGRVQTSAATNDVDALESAGRNQPRPWVGRNPIARPLLESRGERFLVPQRRARADRDRDPAAMSAATALSANVIVNADSAGTEELPIVRAVSSAAPTGPPMTPPG